MERINQAIVLAAGEGQRLRPFTSQMPKVMLPIADKPILQYVIESLAQNGVRRIVIIVGYKKEQVQDYFGSGNDFGVEIEYAFQPQQLGVGHALKQAEELADDQFILIAGDNMIEADTISPLIDASANAMIVRNQVNTSRYKMVILDDDLVRYVYADPMEKGGGVVDIGAYVFTKNIFDHIGDEVKLMPVIQKLLAQGQEISAFQTTGFWQDAVYPWDILKLNDMCLSKASPSLGGTIEDGVKISGPVSIGDGTIIRSNSYIVGPCTIGDNCEIGPSVCVFPSTSIGNGVVIAPFSVVKNSVVGNNVSIGASSSIQDSIIAPSTTIGSHFAAHRGEADVKVEGEYHRVEMGAIIGSYCRLGDNTIAEPGTIIGNNCQIKSMKVVNGVIPDGGLVV